MTERSEAMADLKLALARRNDLLEGIRPAVPGSRARLDAFLDANAEFTRLVYRAWSDLGVPKADIARALGISRQGLDNILAVTQQAA
jgi:hypothetical protein